MSCSAHTTHFKAELSLHKIILLIVSSFYTRLHRSCGAYLLLSHNEASPRNHETRSHLRARINVSVSFNI